MTINKVDSYRSKNSFRVYFSQAVKRNQDKMKKCGKCCDTGRNLCEIEYSETEYSLSQEKYLNIGRRVESFRVATLTHYGIVPTLITTFGLSKGMYAGSIHAPVVLDDLFSN